MEAIKECILEDEFYPKKLKTISDAPKSLYYKGNISLLLDDVVAVIGKRDTSKRYAQMAYRIGSLLADDGYVVLNGLAIGCDTDAIKGALSKKGRVVAIMPCGLDRVYPSSNKELVQQILENDGCIISEYPKGVRPERYRFVQRDRIQAALSDRVVVVDSEKKSGTMHTVQYAAKYKTPVACVMEKGDLPSPNGNIYMVKENLACSITDTTSLKAFVRQPQIKQISLFDLDDKIK